MQFLADERCDFAAVRALRAAGFDVVAVADIAPRLPDRAVVGLAIREHRVVLTEDKDFGQLVYASERPGPGVILIRFPASARKRYRTLSAVLSGRATSRSPDALRSSSRDVSGSGGYPATRATHLPRTATAQS